MRVYIDTGIFLDYLALRGHAGGYVRTAGRRGRTVQQLSTDAAECLKKINSHHDGCTTTLTLYEVENVMYGSLKSSSSGLSDRNRYLITSARSLTIQVLSVVWFHDKLRLIDLTKTTFEKVATEIELQKRAIEAGDSIHVITALTEDVDLIISTDEDILNLDRVFQNTRGSKIQCLDTDTALSLL